MNKHSFSLSELHAANQAVLSEVETSELEAVKGGYTFSNHVSYVIEARLQQAEQAAAFHSAYGPGPQAPIT